MIINPGRTASSISYVAVSSANSTLNEYSHDVIGNKNDTSSGNSIYSQELITQSKIDAFSSTVVDQFTGINSKIDTIDNLLDVPSSGSTANLYVRDVIGNRNDSHNTSTLFGQTKIIKEHTHGVSNFYPSQGSNISLSAGTSDWGLGLKTTIVSSGVITDDFDLHWIHCSSMSAAGDYAVVLYSGTAGAEVKIGETRITRSGVQDKADSIPIMTSLVSAGSRISGAVACSTKQATFAISVGYHTY